VINTKFRKKPVVIEAYRNAPQPGFAPEWVQSALESGIMRRDELSREISFLITTPEGIMRVEPGDWIIRGVKGELYPCKPDIFEATYEREEHATNNDQTIEQEIQAKGLTAPRITPADIEANIVSEHYFTGADGRYGAILNETYVGTELPRDDDGDLEPLELITFCVLVLRNGFTVTGESACASPENFDAELGRKIARQNAVQKIWPLLGFALKERLHSPKLSDSL